MLREREELLLRLMIDYGGYTRIKYLKNATSLSKGVIYNTLEELIKKGYIGALRLETLSSREPNTYHLTYKACSQLGQKNSQFRKIHNTASIFRYLVSNQFMLKHYHDLNIINNHEQKVEFLKSKLSCDAYHMIPHKVIKDEVKFMIEESILNFKDGKEFVVTSGVDISKMNYDFAVVHYDKMDYRIENIIRSSIKKYSGIREKCDFCQVIVVDNHMRYDAALSYINQKINNKRNELLRVFSALIEEVGVEKELESDFIRQSIIRCKEQRAEIDFYDSYHSFFERLSQVSQQNRLEFIKKTIIYLVQSSVDIYVVMNDESVRFNF